MSELLKPLQQTANLIGMKFLPPFLLHGAVQVTTDQIDDSAHRYVTHICDPELDPQGRLSSLLKKMEEEGQALSAAS